MALPLFSFIFMENYKSLLKEERFETRFNAIYMDVNTDKPFAIYFGSLFLARRLIYAMTIMYVSNTTL